MGVIVIILIPIACVYFYNFISDLNIIDNIFKAFETKKPSALESEARFKNALAHQEDLKGNYKKAIELYSEAILKNPRPYYFNNRGRMKIKLGDYKGAIEDFDIAIKKDPFNDYFLTNRAEALEKINEKKGSSIALKKESGSDSNEVQDNLGTILNYKQVINIAETDKSEKKITIKQSKVRINEDILDIYSINQLFHMTHKSNVENILKHGLLPHNKAYPNLNRKNIADNEVNSLRVKVEPIFNRSLHEYVPLYFNPRNPMLYRRKNMQNDIVMLAINRKLIFNNNVIFTDGNAASNLTKFFNGVENLNQLNWNCIRDNFWNNFEDGKRLKCAEVLVYPKVEFSDILAIYCNTKDTLEYIRKFESYHITTKINTDLYFNNNYLEYGEIHRI